MFLKDKSMSSVKTSLVPSDEGHAAHCACPNCDEVLHRFAECSICSEPLQCFGPYACRRCGGVWCARCSRRMSRCALCRKTLSAPATPCLPLQRLINQLLLPCRNYRRGCTELLTADTRAKHEEEDCKFDTMKCPVTAYCCSLLFEELSAHLQSTHNITAVYSQKIKICIENFQTKLKATAFCRTKYNIILLHQKSVFTIKVSIYNYRVRVEVMRRKLGYITDKSEMIKCEYGALIEFRSKALCTKSAILIENEAYSKKTEVQWNNVIMKSDNKEALTIHVNIVKSDSETWKDYPGEWDL